MCLQDEVIKPIHACSSSPCMHTPASMDDGATRLTICVYVYIHRYCAISNYNGNSNMRARLECVCLYVPSLLRERQFNSKDIKKTRPACLTRVCERENEGFIYAFYVYER